MKIKYEIRKNIVLEKSFDFAIRVINLYKFLISKNEFVISKQILRAGTSIGANIRESHNGESDKYFIHKLSIAQKECDETRYWLELLEKTNFISKTEFDSIYSDATELLKLIKSIIISTKKRINQMK
jgi:four helix bundle protein